MKKFLSLLLCILTVAGALTVTAMAKTVELEDDYAKEGDFVLASFNGTKPFFADSQNLAPIEDACYWLGDLVTRHGLKYVSFIGRMSSGPNFMHAQYVAQQGHTERELVEANVADEEWMGDFRALKKTAELLTDMEIAYGVSLGIIDYCGQAFERNNHLQTVFESSDYVGISGYDLEMYDSNNMAFFIKDGNQTYVVYQLEAFPRQSVLNWFNSLQENNRDKRAIVFTTSFIDPKGEMYTQHDWSISDWLSVYYKYNSTLTQRILHNDKPRDGINLWDYALSKWDNIACIVSATGTSGTDIVTNTFKNANGHDVVAVMANLENGYANSGNAYPLLIKISEEDQTVDVRWGVPFYNKVGGYVEETHKEIKVNLADLPDPDPVSILPKVATQSNGNNKAYINGYAGNLFKPNDNMTKAEACTIFARLLTGSQTIPDGYTTRFTDVKAGDWYYNAIAYLDQTGYFYTNTSDKYDPNAKITRAEFVELAYFASNLSAKNDITFTDVDPSNKYYDAIVAAAASGLVNGYGDGSFKPNATITRAEVVTVINRLISILANADTVSRSHLDTVFSDIGGHWAEYQILMASNSNVHGDYYYDTDLSQLKKTSNEIYFENDFIKVTIAKKGGKVTSVINKTNGEEINLVSTAPWFSYLINSSGATVQPTSMDVENGRLKTTYKDGTVVYYLIGVKKDYFTVTLDTNLPSSVNGAVICNLTVNAPWALDGENVFGLSAIAMTTTVNSHNTPGGSAKSAKGTTYTYLGVPTLGSKLGVAFSPMTLHREHLKHVTDEIDPAKGIKSTHGGAYALDNADINGDYVIINSGLYPDNATETAKLAKKYSIEQMDLHQGSTFVQADFNFVMARTEQEKTDGTFIPAKVFKERIADKVKAEGVQLGLHTYSSLVPSNATNILTDPKWQQQIVFDSETYTVRGKVSKFRTNIKTNEDASKFVMTGSAIPWNNVHTRYILIDEEIIYVGSGTTSGFLNVKRGQCGTKPAEHEDGAVIRQLLGWYGMFQSKPLSELFYHIAEETARSYNEGGFEMIYLDGLESFAHNELYDSRLGYYIYAEFVRTVVSNCEIDPLIEYSAGTPAYLWNARARGGATDYAYRAYKNHKVGHINNGLKPFPSMFYTATLGWFNYAPDKDAQFKDTNVRTMYRDDLDHMGSLGIAYNFSTVCQPFSIASFSEKTRLADNFMYYGLYTRLREGNYFSPEVREIIKNGKYEYKLFKQEDGSWAFREMKYFKHKIYDIAEPNFVKGSATNPFEKQTPFIRIEQRYSTKGEDGTLVKSFDEAKLVTDYKGKHTVSTLNIAGKTAFKIRVFGNNSQSDAILITLKGNVSVEAGRNDYFIPLNFSGWKEIILLEINNDDYEGFTFSGIPTGGINYETYRAQADFKSINSVTVTLCGSCSGVKIGDLTAFVPADAPAKNPSLTIGSATITFDAELHGGDFVEYYPDENKAYLNYYTQIYDEEGNWKDDEAHVKEIPFSGSVKVPNGNFEFTYKAEALSDLTTRAQVVIGVSGATIENPADWTEPKVDIPADIEKVTLY